MKSIQIIPKNDKTNGWSKIIPPRIPNKELTKDISVDWVIIGAGLAGLAAARRLAENRPNDSIALVEADAVGEGAQGRNSGFAIDIPHNVGSSMDELNHAHRHLRLARAAIVSLSEVVEKHNINCDWSNSGKFHTAVSKNGINQVLKPTVQTLDSLNEPYEWLEGSALHEKIGFTHFQAGIYTPGTVLLNPAALCKGLADNLPDSVTLYEKTPVIGVKQGSEIKVKTPKGTITANKLIITVNAFSEQFGCFKESIIPIAAHASLTRQLTAAEQSALGGLKSWGLTPANAFVGITMRRTSDQRILIRQGMSYEPKLFKDDNARANARIVHQQLFDERFPMLKGVTMEHTWTGFLAVSRNGAQGFGKIAENVYSAACHNGVGLTKGTIGGLLVADLACEVDNPLIGDLYATGQPTKLPPRPFLDIGVRARFAWELYSKRHEA